MALKRINKVSGECDSAVGLVVIGGISFRGPLALVFHGNYALYMHNISQWSTFDQETAFWKILP